MLSMQMVTAAQRHWFAVVYWVAGAGAQTQAQTGRLRSKIFLSHPAILKSIDVFSSHLERKLPSRWYNAPLLRVLLCFRWCLFARLPLSPSFLNLKVSIHLGKVLPSQIPGMDKRALGKVNFEICSSFMAIISRFSYCRPSPRTREKWKFK